MRECTKCHEIKAISEFGKYCRYPDGIHRKCKLCVGADAARWRADNPERALEVARASRAKNGDTQRAASRLKQPERNAWQRAYRVANREALNAKRAAYRAANPKVQEADNAWRAANRERVRAAERARYAANPSGDLARQRRLRDANPEAFSAYKRKYREKMAASPAFVIATRMSNRMHKALSRGKAGRSWKDLVDYSVEELLAHIERQFLRGMSWANMGEWHIDHIVPVSTFAVEQVGDVEFRRAWALSNLRPLWAKDNIRKGAKRLTLI